MSYDRMTMRERSIIFEKRKAENISIRQLAKDLNRSPSTISRELKRNTRKRGYRPKQAHKLAQERAKRPGYRKLTATMIAEIEVGLQRGWTPDIISNRRKFEGHDMVGRERIYSYIYTDAKSGGALWEYLPRAKRKRKRRCPRMENKGRGKIPNQVMIDQRPAEVDRRDTVGHWEGDLINGALRSGNLVTLVERKTRFTLTGKTKTKCAEEVLNEISDQFSMFPEELLKSITFDNGKEFAYHERLQKKTGLAVYFAMPYHSWERGTNENTNGLIRRLYPKKCTFKTVGFKDLQRIDRYLNDRPRKCLGWQTPREQLTDYIQSLTT